MKLSCLFSIVMCFGIGAIMALPIDDGIVETSNTDHYHYSLFAIRVVQHTAPTDNNTRKMDEYRIAALHSKPIVYDSQSKPNQSSKYPHKHNDQFGYNASVEETADNPITKFEVTAIAGNVPWRNHSYDVIPLKYHVEDVPEIAFKNISIVTDVSETNLPNTTDIPLKYHVENAPDVAFKNISIVTDVSETNLPNTTDIPLKYHVEHAPDFAFDNLSKVTNLSETNLPNTTDIPLKYHVEDAPDVTSENLSKVTDFSETNLPSAVDIPRKYHVKDAPDVVFETLFKVTNVSETNLSYAVDIPPKYHVKNASGNIPNVTNPSETNPYSIYVPLKYYVKDILDIAFENKPKVTNASETNKTYEISIPLENNVEDIPDDSYENIPETNIPYDLPLVSDVENTLGGFENISVKSNISETNIPYATAIPLKDHVDGISENITTNSSDSEANLVDIPLEYHENSDSGESSEEENVTTKLTESGNTSSAFIAIPDESKVNTEMSLNYTKLTEIFENTAEPKLIGCMCALFTTQHPTEYDIPLTSRTFHNVSCQQDVDSEDACNEVCIGIVTINNELKDRMVCSFVSTYVNNLEAFLQSKLCEEDAKWNFTGVSSLAPICCYRGTQIPC